MKRFITSLSTGLMSLAIVGEIRAQTPPPPPPPPPSGSPRVPALPSAPAPAATYTINLKTRPACATPHTKNLARVEGGFIDVATATPHGVTVTMTGTTAANSYLGCTGFAGETFHLVQEFEITCSEPNVHSVVLTLDSALVGFVRSKGRAGACVRRAEVSVTPVDQPGTPLVVAYPPLCVEGTHGQLCNQHLPPVEGAPMPLGRYTLVANFVLDTRASGVCDSHSVADFDPDTTLPTDWVRTRDPFQGVSKKAFGFTFSISAAAPSETPALPGGIRERPAIPLEPPARPSPPTDRGARSASLKDSGRGSSRPFRSRWAENNAKAGIPSQSQGNRAESPLDEQNQATRRPSETQIVGQVLP
jgi:hypothetical protein